MKAYSYIRMSTKGQMEGHSYQRQLEYSQQFAEKNGLELVSTYEDIGVSAFRGKNAKEGAVLSKFLEACENGTVKRGDVLIVENLDRLSRQNPWDAIQLFQKIIKKGIKVVTLMEGVEYTEEELRQNPRLLERALGSLERAHQESKFKAERISGQWADKRRSMHEGKPHKKTKLCPQWLRVVNDGYDYEIIPERQKIVQEIFTLLVDGWGAHKIAKTLNERVEQPFTLPTKRGKRGRFGWSHAVISKMVREGKVIGIHQPNKMFGNKRIPDGDPIENYYPPVISKELYYKAKAAVEARSGFGRPGRQHQKPNVLQGLVKCECGSGTLYAINRYKRKLKTSDEEIVTEYHNIRCASSNKAACTITPTQTKKVNYVNLLTNLMGELVSLNRSYFKEESRMEELENEITIEAGVLAEKEARFTKFRDELYSRGDVSKRNWDFLVQQEQEIDELERHLIKKREKLYISSIKSDFSELDDFIQSSGQPLEKRQQQLRKFIKVIWINAATEMATVDFIGGEQISFDISHPNTRFVEDVQSKVSQILEDINFYDTLASRHPTADVSSVLKAVENAKNKQP